MHIRTTAHWRRVDSQGLAKRPGHASHRIGRPEGVLTPTYAAKISVHQLNALLGNVLCQNRYNRCPNGVDTAAGLFHDEFGDRPTT
jgi:hypothetical protein